MEKADFVEIFHVAFPSRSPSPSFIVSHNYESILLVWFDPKILHLILLVVFRPEDRVNRLAEQLANSEGKIGEIVSISAEVMPTETHNICLISQLLVIWQLKTMGFWSISSNFGIWDSIFQTSSNFFTAMSTMLVLFYLFCDGKTEDNLSQMFNMFDMDGNKVLYEMDMDMDMNSERVLSDLAAGHVEHVEHAWMATRFCMTCHRNMRMKSLTGLDDGMAFDD